MNPPAALPHQAAERLAEALLKAATSAAAACEEWVGKGDKNAADFAAVEAMRGALLGSGEAFRIAIGEGEIDRAPMLHRGEEIGTSKGLRWDVAVDPLEGTTLCAEGLPGAVTAIAGGPPGTILSAPDMYMTKVMAGPACPPEAVHIDNPVGDLIRAYSGASGKPVGEVTVCVLDRPRHANLIEDIRSAGAGVKTIPHGDLPAALWVCRPEIFGVDLYLGLGGAPEGVLSAAMLKALGGSISVRFEPEDDDQAARLAQTGTPARTALALSELIRGDAVLAIGSVTGTPSLEPARRTGRGVRVEALVTSTLSPPEQRLRYHSAEIDSS